MVRNEWLFKLKKSKSNNESDEIIKEIIVVTSIIIEKSTFSKITKNKRWCFS